MNRRPKVTITFAQSLDGRIATSGGVSQWISGPQTLELAHRLRAGHDAILVGIGTVLADDPRLTCRLATGNSPVRVVLDSRLRTPRSARLVVSARDIPTRIFTSSGQTEGDPADFTSLGVSVSAVPEISPGRLDLEEVLGALAGDGVSTLLVEGGSATITSFVEAGAWDRMIVVIAPMLIGKGTDSVGDLGVTDLSSAPRARTVSVSQAGCDVVWELERADAD